MNLELDYTTGARWQDGSLILTRDEILAHSLHVLNAWRARWQVRYCKRFHAGRLETDYERGMRDAFVISYTAARRTLAFDGIGPIQKREYKRLQRLHVSDAEQFELDMKRFEAAARGDDYDSQYEALLACDSEEAADTINDAYFGIRN